LPRALPRAAEIPRGRVRNPGWTRLRQDAGTSGTRWHGGKNPSGARGSMSKALPNRFEVGPGETLAGRGKEARPLLAKVVPYELDEEDAMAVRLLDRGPGWMGFQISAGRIEFLHAAPDHVFFIRDHLHQVSIPADDRLERHEARNLLRRQDREL